MNKRNTVQRALVLDAVKRLRCHATADEVYSTIGEIHPDVSRATVYRNLNLLSEMGEIRKVEIPGGADRYDHECDKHYHAKCIECGRVFDVEMELVTGLEKSVRDTRGFMITDHDIIFKGICLECNG